MAMACIYCDKIYDEVSMRPICECGGHLHIIPKGWKRAVGLKLIQPDSGYSKSNYYLTDDESTILKPVVFWINGKNIVDNFIELIKIEKGVNNAITTSHGSKNRARA